MFIRTFHLSIRTKRGKVDINIKKFFLILRINSSCLDISAEIVYNFYRGDFQMENEILQLLKDMRSEMNLIHSEMNTLQEEVKVMRNEINSIRFEMNEKFSITKSDTDGIRDDLLSIKEDTSLIREHSEITRSAVNSLIEWAEVVGNFPMMNSDSQV